MRPIVQVIAMLAVALVLRASVFGNPNPLADDAFYFLVGQRMHEGVLPYVGVWDRKPPGLFVLFWAIAGISREVIAYQLAATLSAALTAVVIGAMVRDWSGKARGGMLAGAAYLLMLGPLDGFSGQSPVFYNLPMALAAWLVWRGGEGRAWLAMGLCGIALTIKQTCLFESLFLGGYCLWRLRAGGMGWVALAGRAAAFAVLGAGPMLGFALAYWWLGHFAEFWQAMVLSNLAKAPLLPGEMRRDAVAMAVRLAVPVVVAGRGLWLGGGPLSDPTARDPRGFLVGWLAAGLAGVASVPHFFPHYALPWLVPLCAAAGLGFARARGGLVAFALVMANGLLWYDPFDRAWNVHAIASTRALASAVVQHDHGRGLFVFDGPVLLYTMTNRPFLSPLVFPHHLNQAIERNVSHLDTDAEVDRVLALHPGAVVTLDSPRNFPVNWHNWNAVQVYVRANCRRVAVVPSYDNMVVTPTVVHGDCLPPSSPPKPDRITR